MDQINLFFCSNERQIFFFLYIFWCIFISKENFLRI